ncbi:MAG: MFS transporter [Candidatus Omnitrophota bacterium]|nr:MFS transporter [Candidatus Omnitrophota bacterium]
MKKLTFIILCLEGAILSFNVAACAALVPSIAKDFVISEFVAGRIIWLYMLPYGFAALFYGPLVRVYDAKKVEIVCLFIFSLANLLAVFSKNIMSLFAARFLMGIFGASVIPLALILIAESTKTEKRGRQVGIFFGATFVASLLGLFLSGILHWRFIFLLPAIAGFILLILMYFYLPNFKPQAKKFTPLENPAIYGGNGTDLMRPSISCGVNRKGRVKESKVKIPSFLTGFSLNYIATFKSKTVLHIFTYIFFISLFYHGVQQWLGVYFSKQYGLEQFMISALITLTSLSGIFGETMGGWLSDVIGRARTANIGIVIMIISVFILVFKMPPVALVILMIVWGFGWTLNHAGISTILTDLPKEHLNEAASLNSGVRFISGGIGAVLGGAIMQKSFILGFIIFGICLLGLLLFSKQFIIKV